MLIDEERKRAVFEEVHMGHPKLNACLEAIRLRFFWKSAREEVSGLVRKQLYLDYYLIFHITTTSTITTKLHFCT